MGLLAVLVGACLWAAVRDLSRPIPEPLLHAGGSVESLRITQRRGRDDQIYFRLGGHAGEFNVTQGSPAVGEVMDRLRVGSQVELQLGPDGPYDIWGLRLDGRELLTPPQRQHSLRLGGAVAAVLAGGGAVLALWLWRVMAPGRTRVPRQRPGKP